MGVATLATASVMTVASSTRADDSSFRCPTDRFIKLGDPLFEAKGVCGEPTQVAQRNEKERVGLKARHVSGSGRDFIEERDITVEVEEWYYDLGSKRQSRLLRFENGRLAAISRGQLGTGVVAPTAGNAGPDAGAK
jgi:hypothetical protein